MHQRSDGVETVYKTLSKIQVSFP